jgi:hypothetical protein
LGKSLGENMKFYADRDVAAAEGTQTYWVEADTEEEAMEKFESGQGDLSSNDVEVLELGPWDWGTLYRD